MKHTLIRAIFLEWLAVMAMCGTAVMLVGTGGDTLGTLGFSASISFLLALPLGYATWKYIQVKKR